MKVLITLDYSPAIGGIQFYLSSIVRHTFAAHDRVLVGARPPRNDAGHHARVEYCVPPWFPIVGKSALLLLLVRYLLIRALSRGEVEVRCGNVYAALVPWLVSRFVRCRYSVYTYGTELLGLTGPGPKAAFLRAVLGGAVRLVALGSFTEDLLRRAGLGNEVVIEPPRISCSRQQVLDAAARRSAGQVPAVWTILSVGRLVPHKGHDILVQALARLPGEITWNAVIVGEGPQRDTLGDLCRNLGLEDRIEIKARLAEDELAQEYQRASVFVLPSRMTASGVEGFGIVLLHAMANAVPIIASRVGGIADVVADCGRLVEPGDPAALSAALSAMIDDGPQRQHFIEAAARRVVDTYGWH